jgi:hypothetical protein
MSKVPHIKYKGFLKLFILWGTLLFAIPFSQAQEPVVSPDETQTIEEALEIHAETLEDDYDYTDLFSELEFLRANPIPINIANYDDIRQLFFLNDIQINNLLKYIADYGKIVSIYELAYIDGFDREVIAMLEPFITLSDAAREIHITPLQALRYGKNQLFLRYQQLLENQQGFLPIEDSILEQNPNQRYLGSPYRLYTRYAFNYRNRLRWGITAEKDPGEEFFKGSQKQGYDFYSVFFYLKGDKLLRTIVVGDYHLQFGQGLTMWTTFSFGKSGDVTSIRKIQRGIRPNTSVNENQFLRGSAVTLGYRRFTFTAFGSRKNVDATIALTDSITGEVLEVSALQYTGLHRTPRELENRRSLGETIYGARGALTGSRFQTGFTFYKMEFDASLEPAKRLYNQHYFRGEENHAMGADLLYLFRGGQFFGEVSRSASGGMALLAGGSLFPSSRMVLSGVYRKYDKDYHNLYNAPFSESSNAAGEEGLFAGILFLVSPKITFTGYIDYFRFNWLMFRADAPSRGKEYMGEFTSHLSRAIEIRIRYRYKQRERNLSGNESMPLLEPYEKQNIRFHIHYQIMPELTLRNRLEWVVNTSDGKNPKYGYMMYQDVIWKPGKQRWAFSARYALFDTDTFDERIYAYENDVLYAFSVPAYYYKGSRTYLLVRYQASRKIDLWFRLSQTWFSNEKSLGSGLDTIEGNTRTEAKAQIRYKF